MPLLDSIMAFPQRFTVAPFNVTFNNVAGTTLVVGVEIEDGASVAVTGITYNSVAMTKIDNQSWNTTAEDVSWWYLNAPATGSNTIAVTTSGTINGLYVTAASLTGADPKHPIRQSAKATSTSATPSVTLSNVLTGSVCFDLVGTGAGVLGWGQNLLWVDNNSGTTGGDNVASQYSIGNGNQNAVMNYSVTSDLWGMVAFEVQGPVSLSESALADVYFDAYGPIRFLSQTVFQPDAFQENAFQEYGGTTAGGGGSTYNEAVSESALAQDILLAAQGFAQPDSYSALAQDQSAAALGWNAVISEASLARDLLNGAQGVPGSLSELVTTAEQLAAAAGFTAFFAENAPAQEQLATAQAMLAAFSENASARDVALPALQMPVGQSEFSLADVLFDSTLLRPGTGNQYNESLMEACIAQDALAGALGAGGGVEAKIGGAAASVGTSIFVFDD